MNSEIPRYTPSAARRDLFRILDSVIESQRPVYIERHGRKIKLELVEEESRLEKLAKMPKRRSVTGSDEELINTPFEWNGGEDLG